MIEEEQVPPLIDELEIYLWRISKGPINLGPDFPFLSNLIAPFIRPLWEILNRQLQTLSSPFDCLHDSDMNLARTNTTLINLVSKIESKPKLEWNHDPMLIESTNLGMWGCHNQLWMIWLISQEFERHRNLISSKSLYKNQRELTLSPIASKLILLCLLDLAGYKNFWK